MTDIRTRWREIEIDREESHIDSEAWAPFAKAFQGLRFSFLNEVPLDAALALRREERLERMRHFLRKVWNATSKTDPFDEANIPSLAAELQEKVDEAEVEWKKIDRDLLKLVGATAGPIIAAGALITTGGAAWLAAAVAAGFGVVNSTLKRKEFELKYPAGFFVDLRRTPGTNG